MTKGITMATAKAVAAGNSCRQEDIIATANLSRRAIADMLHSCKVHSPDSRAVMRAAADRCGVYPNILNTSEHIEHKDLEEDY